MIGRVTTSILWLCLTAVFDTWREAWNLENTFLKGVARTLEILALRLSEISFKCQFLSHNQKLTSLLLFIPALTVLTCLIATTVSGWNNKSRIEKASHIFQNVLLFYLTTFLYLLLIYPLNKQGHQKAMFLLWPHFDLGNNCSHLIFGETPCVNAERCF